jgi:hypothetical protein
MLVVFSHREMLELVNHLKNKEMVLISNSLKVDLQTLGRFQQLRRK